MTAWTSGAERVSGRKSGRAASKLPAAVPIVIEQLSPVVDAGRYAPKRVSGDTCVVGAAIFRDGHDILAARVRYLPAGTREWQTVPMLYDYASDRWSAEFPLNAVGNWAFTVDAWTDVFGTWRRGARAKLEAGQDIQLELLEAAEMMERTARRMRFGVGRRHLTSTAHAVRNDALSVEERVTKAFESQVEELMRANWSPPDLTSLPAPLPLRVDAPRAAFAAWYEFFPRSTAAEPGEHGTFRDAERVLPRIAELGFDVVYLPPIHPIGNEFRKGRNNTTVAEPGDVGSPWAIGSDAGGHDAVAPELGSLEDFERFVQHANGLGLQVALDFALQCAPDHPWVKEHPDWFVVRPDGSIQYAENPPKKYQDIYPLNFWCDDREALWQACLNLLLFWIERGVTTFRVDNPHTKPFQFWEWAIAEVHARYPDIVFLSEAFTRPNKLLTLAKLGFTQSYTYFTWKNTSAEIHQFMGEFSTPDVLEYYRGNFFANTPDILHEYLQSGGRAAFRVRLLLAGTLSPVYGIYSGFELSENVPVREGSEEYMDSEKYQLRSRNFNDPAVLDADILRLNEMRRAQPALQRADNLTFHHSENPQILWFSKRANEGEGNLLVAVNLDPAAPQESTVHVPLYQLGIGADEPYQVEDLLTGTVYSWRGERSFVRLDPAVEPGHVFRVLI
ncbi:MAG TPA: alpha-1,4-glucan--maltose-1-phosphate maltosyltransferase [Gemmatimonadales bacterium]|nr:alpha-1,4-glucan--maltose-1-phosphate maltosyltransferase [Gemmatimonadales bacterium]